MKQTPLSRSSGLRRTGGPKRAWNFARRKVEEEGRCRICGDTRDLQAAHILGREHDKNRLNGERDFGPVWIVEPVRIVPLGGPHGCDCHGRYDPHTRGTREPVDLLPALTLEEQLQAVRDAGGVELARRRTCPSLYREKEGS